MKYLSIPAPFPLAEEFPNVVIVSSFDTVRVQTSIHFLVDFRSFEEEDRRVEADEEVRMEQGIVWDVRTPQVQNIRYNGV